MENTFYEIVTLQFKMEQQHPAQEREILAPPTDGVSCIRFSKSGNKNHLLVSSWDAVLRVYDGVRLRTKVELENPLLTCCYGLNETEAFTGGLDCIVKQIDLNTKKIQPLGQHQSPVRHVEYSKEYGLAVSGGWDGHVKVWDVRNAQGALLTETKLNGKVFAMDLQSHLLVVGTSERQIGVYDLRNFTQPIELKESPLKYQIRCVRIFPEMKGYALGSIEGRVGLQYFNGPISDTENEMNTKSYAFKCHRGKIDDHVQVYPVNAIAFHPGYGTFATGGCDGVVNMWDGENKKRITLLRKYATRYDTIMRCLFEFIYIYIYCVSV
jgi:cell cycle arrest protein BUB3